MGQVEIISALPRESRITTYRVGPMVDLCRGPHVPSTAAFKAVAVTNASRAFWRGDVKNDPLNRVYAITFPESKLMKVRAGSKHTTSCTETHKQTCA